MNNIKTAILDLGSGIFVGQLIGTVAPPSGPLNVSTAPIFFLKLFGETAAMAYLTTQYMRWRGTWSFTSRDNFALFYLLSLYVNSSGFVKRLRMAGNWIQHSSVSEIKAATTGGGSGPSGIPTTGGMSTQTQPDGGYNVAVRPTDSANGDLQQVPFLSMDT